MIKTLLASAAILAAGTFQANAFDVNAMSDEERAAFRAEIRAYLLDNPQVIMEAVQVLEQREAEAQQAADRALVSANADALLEDGHSVTFGNPEGSFTIVEFIDYRCGYCRRAHPEVAQLLELDGDIRLIMKEFPILGQASTTSSRFALATQRVAGDDAYRAVHEALITLDQDPSEPILRRLAGELELDADAILAEMGSQDITNIIASNQQLAQTLKITGTPSFVFGNQMVRGYVPLQGMQQIVAQERDRDS